MSAKRKREKDAQAKTEKRRAKRIAGCELSAPTRVATAILTSPSRVASELTLYEKVKEQYRVKITAMKRRFTSVMSAANEEEISSLAKNQLVALIDTENLLHEKTVEVFKSKTSPFYKKLFELAGMNEK